MDNLLDVDYEKKHHIYNETLTRGITMWLWYSHMVRG